MAVPELPWALVAGAGATMHARSQSWPVPRAGAAAMEHVVVPELPRAMVVGAGATRHMVASELPCARIWEPRDIWACAPVLSFIFDLELVRGGTRSSGYRQHRLGL
jgi:hypothetical protein